MLVAACKPFIRFDNLYMSLRGTPDCRFRRPLSPAAIMLACMVGPLVMA